MIILNKLKSFSHDAIYYGMSSVISRVVGFLLVPLYTQFLTPSDYGIMTLLGFYTMFFSPLSHLGLQGAMFRYVGFSENQNEEDVILSTALKTVLPISLFFTIIAFILKNPIEVFLLKSNDYSLLIYLTIFSSFMFSITQLLTSYLRIKREVKKIFYINFLNLVFSVSLNIYLIVFVGLGLNGAIWTIAASSVFGLLLILFNVRLPLSNKFNFSYLKKMFKYGIPNVPNYLQAIIMALFGQFYLSNQLSLEELGYYAVAWKFCLPLVVVLSIIHNSWKAYKFDLLKSSQKVDELFTQFSSIMLMIYSFIFLIICFWGGDFLKLFTDTSFHSAEQYVSYLCLIPLFQAFYHCFSSFVSFGEKQTLNPFIGLGGLIFTVISSYILIPNYGIIGAAFSTSFGWLVMAILAYLYGQTIYKVNFQLYRNIPIFVFVIFSAIFLNKQINEFLILIINLLIFLINIDFARNYIINKFYDKKN